MEKERHAVAVVDFDADRAGEAVATSAAEVARELGAVAVDYRLEFRRERGRAVLERDKLVELGETLDAPDGDHMRKLGEECIGCGCVGYEPARESLHGDEADVVFGTLVDKREFLVRGEVRELELEGLVEARVDGLLCDGEAVVGDADMENLALLACFEHSLVES